MIARLAGTAAIFALIWWRFPDLDLAELVPKWRPTLIAWLALAFALTLASYALQTLRWQGVLSALGVHPPLPRLFTTFMAGQFVSSGLPTTFGGDVVRIAGLSGHTDPRTGFASVTLERLTGWLVLPAISFTSFAAEPELLRQSHGVGWSAVTVCAVTLVALCGLLGLVAGGWCARFVDTGSWRDWLGSVHQAVHGVGRSPRSVGRVLVAGIAFQVCMCLAVWAVGRSLGVAAVTPAAALAFVPAASILMNLPVGFGGLGVREAAFVTYFGALGAPRAQCISLGLVVYAIGLITSTLGAAPMVAWRRGDPMHSTGAARTGST